MTFNKRKVDGLIRRWIEGQQAAFMPEWDNPIPHLEAAVAALAEARSQVARYKKALEEIESGGPAGRMMSRAGKALREPATEGESTK